MSQAQTAPKSNKRIRRHHYLPVFYQRRFTDPRGLLWMHDLEQNKAKHLHPRAALAIENFNTIETNAGASDAIERGLAEIDGEGATALRRIEQGFWPAFGEVREALSMFIAFQLTRGPGFRAQMDHYTHEITSLMMKVQATRPDSVRRKLHERLGREPTKEEFNEEVKLLRTFGERFKVSNNRQGHVRTMVGVHESGQIASILFRRAWSLESTTSLDFITSDDPVTLWNKNPLPWEGVGVMTADEVRFPLGTGSCLVMHHPWKVVPDRQTVPAERVLELNAWTILNSHRFVLARQALTNLNAAKREKRTLQMEQISGPQLTAD